MLKNRRWLGVLLIAGLALPPTVLAQDEASPLVLARKWLEGQTVPSPLGGSMIVSYASQTSARSFIYDQALAIIAFTMLTDYERAADLISGLIPLMNRNGALQFSYDAKNPVREKQSMIRTGALAWMGYAVCFYLDASGDRQNRKKYLAFADSMARYVRARQVRKRGDVRQWLVTGGHATVRLESDPVSHQIKEIYVPGPITWCSVEHNVDAYFFFKLYAQLSVRKVYAKLAQRMKEGLLQKCWNENLGQFVRGVNLEEGMDKVRALDCASWGAMFLHANGEHRKVDVCIRSLENYYNEVGELKGYKAYYDKPVYENYMVGLTMYPDNPRKTWREIHAIWPEGTLGVATLMLQLGRAAEAEKLMLNMEKMQDAAGGIPYHSMVIPYEFETNPSVASTAWYLMNRMMGKDQRLLKKFWN